LHEKDIIQKVPSTEEKEHARKINSIAEQKVILSVGQFIHRKGYDVLLKAVANLPRNIGIYIIGGKATPEYKQIVDEYTLEVKITNPPENLEEYEVRVGTKEITVKADGSDTYTCELSYFCNTVTNYAGVSIRTKNKNGDVSITADKFYYMSAPEILEIKRQKNGYVEMTINQGNYDDIGWDGYYIYRKVYGESEYQQIAVLDSPCTEWYYHETTYTDTTAEKGVKYVYLVKSFKEYEGKTYVSYYDKRTVK
jgi:glycosyltransferase involved in cell wall biosynthesis